MQKSFTGNARRPRQVNLSGRNSNPFAAISSPGKPSLGSGASNTLAVAQQERLLRKQDRERLGASKLIQRIWRGHRVRSRTKGGWRQAWDQKEYQRCQASWTFDGCLAEKRLPEAVPYRSAPECLQQLSLLLQFHEVGNATDCLRLAWLGNAIRRTFETLSQISAQEEWTMKLARLSDRALRVLPSADQTLPGHEARSSLLHLLVLMFQMVPKEMASRASRHYRVLSGLATSYEGEDVASKELLVEGILAPLRPITSSTIEVYESFATDFLIVADLPDFLGISNWELLATGLNYKALASAMSSLIHSTAHNKLPTTSERRIWLLTYFIYFYRYVYGHSRSVMHADELTFIDIVSQVMGPIADGIAGRIDLSSESTGDPDDESPGKTLKPLPPFVREQLLSLITQQHVTELLSKIGDPRTSLLGSSNGQDSTLQSSVVLADYALTLLRAFPKKGDELRMWLCLGSATSLDNQSTSLPAIKFFWTALKSTGVFKLVSEDSRAVLKLILLQDQTDIGRKTSTDVFRDWRVIILFLELYTFVLKVTDDEEFLSGNMSSISNGSTSSWTKASALPLGDVKSLTTFLKNLAFTLYWNAKEISTIDAPAAQHASLNAFFDSSAPTATLNLSTEIRNDILGMSLPYFKGLVTGLLRTIHDRDSRRKFFPEGHWLMTDRFDMEGFIENVVAEEEKRHQLHEDDPEDEEDTTQFADELNRGNEIGMISTRTRQAQRVVAMQRQQKEMSRKRLLEAVAPRLEILRDLPFFIPFATRVQIFRAFIHNDQIRRRNGYVEPDIWRMLMQNSALPDPTGRHPLDKHRATIRREHILDDAFEEFYELGEGLKEPIQITFVDQFGSAEAGIDGGGVTKEFLMSVTSEAFDPNNNFKLFIENDQHLLYPNPTAVEQRKELLRAAGIKERTPLWNEDVRNLLRRFEFLGRVIGKCLYEGILVDVNFAGFFLLKWALTGGAQSASRESSYRANLNDLRDLDETLYQGLLQLKNYPGNVEDFSLDFTVTDTIPLPDGSHRNVTKDLKPDGSKMAVTNQNRLVYISYIARHRLQIQPHAQTSAFLQGLGQMIQPAWLSMFNQNELQTLVGGDSGEIDIADLRRNTQYGGLYVIGDDHLEHPTIQLFWKVMESMSHEERRKVLKYVTSTPRAPLLGFGHLNPHFSIHDSSNDQDRLPSTSTCVNLLKLPLYRDAKTMREKLLYAISSGAGFDLS